MKTTKRNQKFMEKKQIKIIKQSNLLTLNALTNGGFRKFHYFGYANCKLYKKPSVYGTFISLNVLNTSLFCNQYYLYTHWVVEANVYRQNKSIAPFEFILWTIWNSSFCSSSQLLLPQIHCSNENWFQLDNKSFDMFSSPPE